MQQYMLRKYKSEKQLIMEDTSLYVSNKLSRERYYETVISKFKDFNNISISDLYLALNFTVMKDLQRNGGDPYLILDAFSHFYC